MTPGLGAVTASAEDALTSKEIVMDWNRVEGSWKQVKGKVKEKELFRLKIIFETFTTFLKIPYPMLERVLYDEQMTKREMADCK